MLASLLPGLRELRAPLAAGYLWLLSIYLLIAPHVPSETEAHGIVENLYSLKDAATAVGLGVALSFVAYLVGMLSTGFLNPLLRAAPAWFVRAAGSSSVRWALPARLRRLVDRDYRSDQLSERSWLALNDLVVGTLREVDAVLAPASTTLATLVREEVPARARSRRGGPMGPVERVVDAVADELDLVKTRLLGKEADLFSAVDRHQAERDFRLAVLPPLGVVAVVAAVIADSLLVAPIVVVGSAIVLAGLFRQAVTSDRAGTDVLVDALRLGDRVKSPTLERLAAASRRTAGLPPDAPTPPLLDRAVVLNDATSELGSSLVSVKHLAGQPLDDDSRRRLRAASDGLERLEIYLPQGSRVIQTAREAQKGLRSGSLKEAEWTQLDRHRQTIADLWLIEIERPGQLELLSSDVDALTAALSGGDLQDRLIGVYALREAVSMSSGLHLTRLVGLLKDAISTDGPVPPQLIEAFERAVELTPGAVTQIEWRGVRLEGIVLEDATLRDIKLPDARLAGAKLARCDLSGAQLDNTSLVGADLRQARLGAASLKYTDLADADLSGAWLSGAVLESPLVMGLRLTDADLRAAFFQPNAGEIPWHLIDGWREAKLDDHVQVIATEIAGAAPEGRPVLMLTWEAPPLVAGGSWTACYHLVRRLRALGVDITVVVPWHRDLCEQKPFGADVEVVFAGVEPSVPGAYTASGGPFPPYLPYSAYSPYWWRAEPEDAVRAASTYPSVYYGAPLLALEQFAAWLERWDELNRFVLVHAHDWVTFLAAERAARRASIPWVAHFHSTVADRRPDGIDWLGAERERGIEKHAVEAADAVVVPSSITARRVAEYVGREIHVVPNSLSREAPPPQQVGSLESRRIVFVGRLARQKAPDRFIAIARAAREQISGVEFALIGDGEERRALEGEGAGVVTLEGAKPWNERASAFEKASVVVVPSRSEPFGMVVAEAMQRGVPVLYTGSAGIAEFVDAGVPFSPENVDAAIRELRLLLDGGDWAAVAARQRSAIDEFAASRPEQVLLDRWRQLAGVPIGSTAEASPSVAPSV